MLASPWDGVYATEIRSARRYGRHSHATFGFGVVADGAHRFRESLIAAHEAAARQRLADAGPESELPEIQAWRRGFARMGLKPTQYRCASESLLRRLRKEGTMPRIHPMIDLCNAISMAFAVPVAVLDVARIQGALQVRHADRAGLAGRLVRGRADAASIGRSARLRIPAGWR